MIECRKSLSKTPWWIGLALWSLQNSDRRPQRVDGQRAD